MNNFQVSSFVGAKLCVMLPNCLPSCHTRNQWNKAATRQRPFIADRRLTKIDFEFTANGSLSADYGLVT
jgi:hypothetical protein